MRPLHGPGAVPAYSVRMLRIGEFGEVPVDIRTFLFLIGVAAILGYGTANADLPFLMAFAD